MKHTKIIGISVAVAAVLAAAYAVLYLYERGGLHEKTQGDVYAHYRFSSYFDGHFYTVGPVITSEGEYFDGDISVPLKFCDPASGWICTESSSFEFAAPRRELKVGDHWVFSGVEYSLLPSYRESIPGGIDSNSYSPSWTYPILGKRFELYAIRAIHKGPSPWAEVFLFSPVRGLLAYMLIDDDARGSGPKNSTFWLTEEYGPGSTVFDSHIADKAYIPPQDVAALAK